MKLIKFMLSIKSFWKLYKDYEYDGEMLGFIIRNYEEVLQNRTKCMSKPTYHARQVINRLDEWYGRNIWSEKD